MKFNFKKMKINQVALLLAVIVIIGWLLMRSGVRVEFNEGVKSESLLYVESSDQPNPFILYGMVKKETDDEEKQKKALTLATEKKYDELKEFLKNL